MRKRGDIVGRPKKEIDKKLFEALCALQCTLPEFEDQLGVSDKTLNAWCKREYAFRYIVWSPDKRSSFFVRKFVLGPVLYTEALFKPVAEYL